MHGSKGHKGFVSDLLEQDLSLHMGKESSHIYACGPHPMMAKVAQIARKMRIPAQFSLENHFACGIGRCLGCAIVTEKGIKKVCNDGPVFNSEDLVW